jgi:hypothetical protein
MKRFIKFLFVSIIVVTLAFGIFKVKNKYNLDILNNNVDWLISLKGCEGARSFDFDEEGNLYLAFEDTIRVVNKEGNDELIIKESKFNILDILYHNNLLYIATDNRILEYSIDTKTYKEIVTSIPNNGINKKINLLLNEDKLYFSIGSNTNAGVVNSKSEAFDIATSPWILTGNNYGEGKTGAFSQYSVSTEVGEGVESQKIGNAAVLSYNIKNQEINLFAHGIRNINGWDIDSEGEIKAIIGGMEDIPPRNIKDDKDYIYNLQKDNWYGWPDYSGGDPITSPRFTDSIKQEFLIKNHVDKNPAAPIYQDSDVSSLQGLAIDKDGKCFDKNTVIFGNNKKGFIYALSKEGVARELISLDERSKVEKIIFYKDGFFILDSKAGCLYNLKLNDTNTIFKLPKIFWVFSIVFILVIIVSILIKNRDTKLNKKM